ncbi:COBRA-like protein 10 [Cinnamomum micranthum f. kanehirae]|uniref:COBRA-like protein 10 n=1 Tax=Cinnamomum micranthum f. kanehirae TaxID=337451 RepID=A0A3S3NIT5_9MAGN|nr:COBRA-like protein 10 [Cinnamomum micranthum f. kanehirae]
MISPKAIIIAILLLTCSVYSSLAQDDYGDGGGGGDGGDEKAAPPPALENCNGIFLSYSFVSREKEYPFVKNASAQAYAFKATASIFNAGKEELKAWQMYIGFQHDEIIVSADKGVMDDGTDFPVSVGKNGTTLSGDPPDLKTSVETAGDWNQIQATIDIKGTQFGVKSPNVPMPKTIRLANEGYKCPGPVRHKTEMHVCCVRNPKFKPKKIKPTKFLPHLDGDLIITYDVLEATKSNYQVQVTMDNKHPLGRLDNWNLTWEWKRGEFIYSMKGAYVHVKDPSECVYGPAGKYYQDFDFTPVLNCAKKPIISDLPPDRAKDDKIGNVPFCCRNGSLLPPSMDETKSKAAFTMMVFKVPPDLNRTALFPPQNWKINGVVNPNYKCGAPRRVNPTEFPDTTGLNMISTAIATWEIVCNIARPKHRQSRCCVSFSAFYNESVIPCNTCSCGCSDDDTCDQNAHALLLPPEALLVPFDNRTAKAKAWAKMKHFNVPKRLPCGDNCGVSINWHINTDYRTGWSARITLFNWQSYVFENWFVAIQIPKAYRGFEDVYSFNGTRMPKLDNTIIFQGLPGLNYLIGLKNETDPKVNPPVPGKQQSVISFKKKWTPGINIVAGDGFPSRIYFNGEECQLPNRIPKAAAHRSRVSLLPMIFFAVIIFVVTTDYLC